MKSIWLQEKFVAGELLDEKYMEKLGEKYMARKKCGWKVSG